MKTPHHSHSFVSSCRRLGWGSRVGQGKRATQSDLTPHARRLRLERGPSDDHSTHRTPGSCVKRGWNDCGSGRGWTRRARDSPDATRVVSIRNFEFVVEDLIDFVAMLWENLVHQLLELLPVKLPVLVGVKCMEPEGTKGMRACNPEEMEH